MQTLAQRVAAAKAAQLAARAAGTLTTKDSGVGDWLLRQQDKALRTMDDFRSTADAYAELRKEDKIRLFGLIQRS